MIIHIKVQCEHNECSEELNFTGEGFKNALKNNPEKLLEIIERIEKDFPEPLGGGNGNTKGSSFLLTAAAASSAF
jgi:hypothetical protein